MSDGREHVVYSRNNSGLDAKGRRLFSEEAGLLVRQGKRLISKRACVESADAQPGVNNGADAQVDLQTASRFMPEGEFLKQLD